MTIETPGASVRPATAGAPLPLVLAVGAALVVVNGSGPALGIALPELVGAVGANLTEATWISSVGSVVSAAVLLPIGRAADRWGRRRFLVAGLALFGVAEAATAAATGPEVVIVLRALSGLGTAAVLPISLAVLVAAFPREQRTRAVAVWATTVSVSASLAGIASGQLATAVSWRVMPVVLGVAALALLLPLRLVVSETRDRDAAPDPLGGLLVLVGIGALVLGIGSAGQGSPVDPAVLVPLLVGGLGVAAFVAWELRAPAPMLPVRLFADRALLAGMALLVMVTGSFTAYTFIGVQYLQDVRGLTPFETALTFLFTEAGVVATALLVPWLVRRAGVRVIGSLGAGLVAAAFLFLAATAGRPAFWPFAATLVLLGVGFALSFTPASTLVLGGLPPNRLGVASAITGVGRDVGSAVGVALVGAVVLAVYRTGITPALATFPAPTADQVGGGITTAVEAAEALGPAGGAVLASAREAFVDAFRYGAVAAAAVAAAAALLCAALAPDGVRTAREIRPDAGLPDPVPTTDPTDPTRRSS